MRASGEHLLAQLSSIYKACGRLFEIRPGDIMKLKYDRRQGGYTSAIGAPV